MDADSVLAERLGVAEHAEPVEPLLERLSRTGERAWDRLESSGRRHPSARPPELGIPPSYQQVLVAALALEGAEPTEGSGVRAEQIRAHYLDLMPAYRVEQLATSDAPNDVIFHERLDWSRMPRLVGGLDRFFATLSDAGVPAQAAVGVKSRRAFTRRWRTLGELYDDVYFGSYLPFLYGFPNDLAAYQRELTAGDEPPTVFDRRLAAPILHELMHGRRSRRAIFPPYLDECLAGYLGIHVFPEFAYPLPGADNALFSSPWFAQVGQAMVRAFGLVPVLRAHFGVEPWSEALPPELVPAVERLGWLQYKASREVHFLVGNTRPEAWIRLFYLAAAGALPDDFDEESLSAIPFADLPLPADDEATERLLLQHALESMCLRNFLDEGSYRVERVLPPGPVRIDFEAGIATRASAPDSLDLAPPRYTLPPTLSARYRESGVSSLELVLRDVDAVDDVVQVLCEGEGVEESGGSGFELRVDV